MDVGIFVSDRGVIKMTKQGGGGRGGGGGGCEWWNIGTDVKQKERGKEMHV